jgi:hypothetical protein
MLGDELGALTGVVAGAELGGKVDIRLWAWVAETDGEVLGGASEGTSEPSSRVPSARRRGANIGRCAAGNATSKDPHPKRWAGMSHVEVPSVQGGHAEGRSAATATIGPNYRAAAACSARSKRPIAWRVSLRVDKEGAFPLKNRKLTRPAAWEYLRTSRQEATCSRCRARVTGRR